MKMISLGQRVGFLLAAASVALLATGHPARADDAASPLKIAVTAVQGTAEVKVNSAATWQPVTQGMQLPVGCQIRTGVPGTVQLQVGEDQVCRVDRLSLVQVVQAEEDHGKIKTVMGMTYGRVSKDVDAPVVPHEDTIVSPTSTLAVRGTRVSLYDQPPYAPEAVSLTGNAIYTNAHHRAVPLGKKHGGTVKVDADSNSAAEYELQNEATNPAPGTDAFLNQASQSSNRDFAPHNSLATGIAAAPTFLTGQLMFQLSWMGLPFAVLDFGVSNPKGNDQILTVSPTTPFVPTATPPIMMGSVPSIGRYVTGLGPGVGTVASVGGLGNQEILWGINGTFPTGTYTVTEKLEGTKTEAVKAGFSIMPTLQVTETLNSLPTRIIMSAPITLDGSTATSNAASFSFTVTKATVTPLLVKK